MKGYVYNMRVLICLAVFSVVFTPGCRKKNAPEKPDVNHVEVQAPVPAQTLADGVAATVNGVDIKESEVAEQVEEQLKAISEKASSQLPPNFIAQYKTQLRAQFLEKLIVEELLSEKIKEDGIEVTDEEAENTITAMLSSQKPPLSLEDYKKKLEEYGRDYEKEKERIREQLAYQKILKAQYEGKLNVTREEARKYYDENQKLFETAEKVRASHILIKPVYVKGGDMNEPKAKAYQKAEEILEKVKKGADFAVLAKASSACPSASKGGDLGYFEKGQMTPTFEEAAFDLNVGDISDIVETEYGYHIIKVTDHKDAGTIPYEEAEEKIIEQLNKNKQVELTNEYIKSLKADADIIYAPDEPM